MDRETLFDIGADRAGFFKSIFTRRAIFALAGFDSVYSGAWRRECLGNPDGLTDNFFCNEITRNGEGQITQIINRDLNLNKIVRSGIDVGLDYRFDAPPVAVVDGQVRRSAALFAPARFLRQPGGALGGPRFPPLYRRQQRLRQQESLPADRHGFGKLAEYHRRL